MSQQLLSQLENLFSSLPNSNENKIALESLKLQFLEKEANLDILTNHISEGYFKGEIICDSEGRPIDYRFKSANKNFKEHTGLETKFIIGKTVVELFPDIEKSWIEFYGEIALTEKSKSILHLNHNTNKYYIASGFCLKKGEFIALFQDVTKDIQLKSEKKQKEDSLKLNTDILANMRDGFGHYEVIYDNDGIPIDIKILQVNQSFRLQTGVEGNDLIGKPLRENFPNLADHWIDILSEVATTQIPKSFIHYGKATNRNYEVNAYSPHIGQVIAIFKDVTELIEQQLKIKESESIKAKIIDNMLDGFVHTEIIYNENNKPVDYRILGVNKAFEKQTGIKASEFVGKTILEFFPDIEESWIEMVIKVALTQKPLSTTLFNHNTQKYFEINAYSPKRGQAVKIMKDITKKENERQQLERAYKKAEENELLKSAFLANMSHEIRTPMNGILGCTALLENEGLDKDERKKCLDYIKTSGNRLMRLISDIVDLSKIDALEQELQYADYNLNNIMDSLLHQFRVSHINKKIKLNLKKGVPEKDFNIKTDEVRLTQILNNLLENAFKFTKEGSIEFGYRLENDQLVFYVKDTGKGIRKKDQKLIFKRFGQVKDYKTKMNHGTGLGTSIAKGLVSLFKGEIWLESEFGKGSTFHFSIPYIPPN